MSVIISKKKGRKEGVNVSLCGLARNFVQGKSENSLQKVVVVVRVVDWILMFGRD